MVVTVLIIGDVIVFSCFIYVDLFSEITTVIVNIDYGKCFGKTYSATDFLLQGNKGIQQLMK